MAKKKLKVEVNNKKIEEPPKKPFPIVKVLNILVLVGLVILLFYAPFFRGLYFNEEMSTTFLYSGLLFLIFLIKRFIDKDFKVFKTPLDIAAILLVIVYALPIMFQIAASSQGAWDKLLRYINYFLIYLMCRDIIKEDKNIKILLNAIIVSALGVCTLGIDAGAGAGLTNKINWIFSNIPLWMHLKPGAANLMSFKFFGGFAEGRIFSTLQYPNVLASYLGAVFFLIVGLLMVTKSYWKRAWYGIAGFIAFYTFILTGSRGMVLVLPIMVLILFASFWNKKLILSFIIDAFIPVVTGVLFSAMYGNYVNSGQYLMVWLSIAVGILISALLTSFIQKLKDIFYRVSIKVYAVTAGIVIIISVCLIALALNIEKPLLMKHDAKEANSDKIVIRDITNIKPSTKYILNFDIDAHSNSSSQDSYKITALSMDKFVNLEQIAQITGKTERNRKQLEFVTKTSTRTVRFQLENFNKDTSATFSNFILKETDTGKENRLIIQYKFLPTDLVYKIQDISLKTHNAWERLVFVEDAFKIIGAYPLGTGGGGWKALYHEYQSYDYSSSEVHDYPVQLWVETGILGIAALIIFVVLIIHHYSRIRIKEKEIQPENTNGLNSTILAGVIFTAILSLYAHSVIDFDFSLSAIPIMAWALTGIISGMYLFRPDYEEIKIPSYVSYPALGLIVIFPIMLTITGFNSVSGRNLIAQANIIESSFKTNRVKKTDLAKALPELIPIYKNYLELQPLDEKRRQRYIECLNSFLMISKDLSEDILAEKSSELKQNIEINVNNEPNSMDGLATAASYSLANGKFEEGLAYANRLTAQGRFIEQVYSIKGQLYMLAGETAIRKGQKANARKYFIKAAGIKKEFEESVKKSLKPIAVSTALDKVVNQAQQILIQLGGA